MPKNGPKSKKNQHFRQKFLQFRDEVWSVGLNHQCPRGGHQFEIKVQYKNVMHLIQLEDLVLFFYIELKKYFKHLI